VLLAFFTPEKSCLSKLKEYNNYLAASYTAAICSVASILTGCWFFYACKK
jgi:hypothetical protein